MYTYIEIGECIAIGEAADEERVRTAYMYINTYMYKYLYTFVHTYVNISE